MVRLGAEAPRALGHLLLPALPRRRPRRHARCELDPEPPLVTVIDVQGSCEHANGFGQLDQLTLEQEWELIEAALDAASGAAS